MSDKEKENTQESELAHLQQANKLMLTQQAAIRSQLASTQSLLELTKREMNHLNDRYSERPQVEHLIECLTQAIETGVEEQTISRRTTEDWIAAIDQARGRGTQGDRPLGGTHLLNTAAADAGSG